MSKLDGIEDIGPYQAQYIVTPPEEKPEGCLLPPELPSPPLPDLLFPDLPLECQVNFNVPLVPLPPTPCLPLVFGTSSFKINVPTGKESLLAVTGTQIQLKPVSELDPEDPDYDPDSCDIKLLGDLELTPCVPSFSGTISVTEGTETGGSITLSGSGDCGAILSGSITIGTGGGGMVQGVITAAIGAADNCETPSANDFPHLAFDEDTGVLSLEGSIPTPCFSCSPDLTDPFTFNQIDLSGVFTANLRLGGTGGSSCCSESSVEAGWVECGRHMFIQSNSHSFEVLMADTTGPSVELAKADGSGIKLDTAAVSAATGGYIQVREWNVCVAGQGAKRVKVLASEYYD